MHFNVILPFTPMSSSGLFPSDFPTKVLCVFLFLMWNRTFPVQIPRPAILRRCTTLSVAVLCYGYSIAAGRLTVFCLLLHLALKSPNNIAISSFCALSDHKHRCSKTKQGADLTFLQPEISQKLPENTLRLHYKDQSTNAVWKYWIPSLITT